MNWIKRVGIAALIGLCAPWPIRTGRCQNPERAAADWRTIGGTPGNSHYSSLKQINRSNVQNLQEAWRFDTGQPGGLETTPIVVDGILYAFTPTQQVIALNGETGKLLWKFDSGIKGTQPDRGITYWTDRKEKRLLAGVMNFVYALDPATGKVIQSFGNNGRIDLREDLGREPVLQSVALTSPGVIYKDLLIVGGRNPETLPAPPGDIRAYSVRTGALRWVFHTIPHPGEFGCETWPKDAWKMSGAANNWAGMAVDLERGIVFVPTGSAVPDFYGASRIGDDLFADTLLALDAATGKRLWHFQGVHHDIWDRDFPAPPILVAVKRNGKEIPAVAQTTKQGYLYLFDRVSGAPLFPIRNRTYPPSTTPGETASPTQPFPLAPEPFARQTVTEDTLTNRTPEAHAWAVQRFRELRHDGQFVPLSVGKDTLVSPSFEGGAEWGGPAIDPETDVLYINSNNYASMGALAVNSGGSAGRRTYLNQCAVCHGDHRQGTAEFPPLLKIGRKTTAEQIAVTIHEGKGRMPAMPVDGKTLKDLLNYLATEDDAAAGITTGNKEKERAKQYSMTGYRRFLDPDGYPATAPPWGTLNALDLKTGKYLWQIPLGQYPELAAKGMTDTGSENYGGPIVTSGGLIFIAATNFDHKIRAFDTATGKLLWEAALPFAGNATPATYEVHGKQYVLIAAGGSSMNPKGPIGGVYVAFALPK
ncbi:MAG TPA: pyrroloquinoline quinone-dependent dehydrogenase [Terracidiphilus sp.]|nr:pyrroloquinoline quinone-dependent dehydrogenase [Terracidiphilus sp.]